MARHDTRATMLWWIALRLALTRLGCRNKQRPIYMRLLIPGWLSSRDDFHLRMTLPLCFVIFLLLFTWIGDGMSSSRDDFHLRMTLPLCFVIFLLLFTWFGDGMSSSRDDTTPVFCHFLVTVYMVWRWDELIPDWTHPGSKHRDEITTRDGNFHVNNSSSGWKFHVNTRLFSPREETIRWWAASLLKQKYRLQLQ